MRKLLTTLAASTLVGSLFLGVPKPVAAVSSAGDAGEETKVKVTTGETHDRYYDTSRNDSDGKRQTYVVAGDGTTAARRLTMQITVVEDGANADLKDTVNLTLSNATFTKDDTATIYDDKLNASALNGSANNNACDLNWTETSSTAHSAAIDCTDATGGNGATTGNDHTLTINFEVTLPASGASILTVASASANGFADYKVFFYSTTASESIYVGSGAVATGKATGCASPDFSSNDNAQYTPEEAVFAALSAVDESTDTIVLCGTEFVYEANDIEQYEPGAYYTGAIYIRADDTVNGITINGDDADSANFYQLLNVKGAGLHLTDLHFVKGQTTGNGGAVRVENGALTIVDSSFSNNDADGDGGAVYLENGAFAISNATFQNNYADGAGGAVSFVPTADLLTVADSYFSNNVALGDGGQLDVQGSAYHVSNDVTITDSEFFLGVGGYGGAGCFEDVDTLTLDGVVMSSNYVTNNNGGAVWTDADHTVISDSTFEDNHTGDYGGAVYTEGNYIEISDSTFTSNDADYAAGAVYAEYDLDISGSTFTDNDAIEYAGAVYGHDTTISESTFTDNVAGDSDGGAVNVDGDLEVSDSTFASNEAAGDGGAIWAAEDVEITASVFTENTSADEGGAVFGDGSSVTVNGGSLFRGNTSTYWGGALSAPGTLTVDRTTFVGNVSNKGGAIDSWGDRFYLTNSSFINNKATQWGGAITRGGRTYRGDISRTNSFRGNRSKVGATVALYWMPLSIGRRDAALWKIPGVTPYFVQGNK